MSRGRPLLICVLLVPAVANLFFTNPEAQAWDWRNHIHIGPDPYPPPDGPNVPSFYKEEPPLDWGPYPESSYHWPTLRQALNQYGWFGRRAGSQSALTEPASHQGGPSVGLAIPELLPPPRRAATALIQVLVPAGASIWFDGQATSQIGPERVFQTPALDRDAPNVYEIRARWSNEGQEVHRSRVIRVAPGEQITVDFVGRERVRH